MAGLETDKIVFKPLSYEELSISLERLQRFNNPFKKYDRVYREILIKHLIFPKISLKNYYEFSFGIINFLAQLIWNESVRKINPNCKENYEINPYLFYEEIKEFSAKEILRKIIFSENISGYAKPANFAESDFICDEKVLKDLFEKNGINFDNKNSGIPDVFSKIYIAVRMNYPLNIDGFLADCEQSNQAKDFSKNIKRLIWINKQIKRHALNFHADLNPNNLEKIYKLAETYRNDNYSQKPLKLLILAEGATEDVLLPAFSSAAGVDFDKNGIEVMASGGKNQVARIYAEINRETNLPIFIILDADAQEIANEINKNIRQHDRLYLISKGEFEDILPDELICRAINSYYGLTGKIKKEEINIYSSKTDSLSSLWKQKGFGEFKKAEFAHIIAENIKTPADLSEEMRKIISNIQEMLSE
jgi:hypothetical protein